jgi:hypothetical protein
MECGWPRFRPNGDGSRILSGIYGTPFVDYLTIPNFDQFDRGADVFASHLQDDAATMDEISRRYDASSANGLRLAIPARL